MKNPFRKLTIEERVEREIEQAQANLLAWSKLREEAMAMETAMIQRLERLQDFTPIKPNDLGNLP